MKQTGSRHSAARLAALVLSATLLAGCVAAPSSAAPPHGGASSTPSASAQASRGNTISIHIPKMPAVIREAEATVPLPQGTTTTPPTAAPPLPPMASFASSGAVLHSETALTIGDGLYFITQYYTDYTLPPIHTLYYTDSETIYHVMDNVYSIAGVDEEGLYLVVADDDVLLPVPAQEGDLGRSRKASLVRYSPVSGGVFHLVDGVFSALLAPGGGVLFYAQLQAGEQGAQQGHFAVMRRELATGDERALFTDAPITTLGEPTSNGGELAFSIRFTQRGQKIEAELSYPYPSEYPYIRVLVFTQDGTLRLDSETRPYLYEGGMLLKNRATPERFEVQQANFSVDALPGEGQSFDYIANSGGEQRMLAQNATAQYAVPGNELLYLLLSHGPGPLLAYDGARAFPLQLKQAYHSTKLFSAGGKAYLLGHAMDSAMQGKDRFDLYALEGGTGAPQVRFVLGVPTAGTDAQGAPHAGWLDGPTTHTAGPFLLVHLAPLPGCLVLNTATGSVAALGTPGMELLLPQATTA